MRARKLHRTLFQYGEQRTPRRSLVTLATTEEGTNTDTLAHARAHKMRTNIGRTDGLAGWLAGWLAGNDANTTDRKTTYRQIIGQSVMAARTDRWTNRGYVRVRYGRVVCLCVCVKYRQTDGRTDRQTDTLILATRSDCVDIGSRARERTGKQKRVRLSKLRVTSIATEKHAA